VDCIGRKTHSLASEDRLMMLVTYAAGNGVDSTTHDTSDRGNSGKGREPVGIAQQHRCASGAR
jgi:hypothetical protein